MRMIFADRMNRLGSETAFEMLAKANVLEAQGREIIHLEIGEPDFPTLPNIIEKGMECLRAGMTKYTPSSGLLEARQAVADYAGKKRGYEIDPQEVVMTAGGKPIMFYAILATVNPGDEVIYPNPGFPIYESVIKFVGGVPVPIPLREENEFRMDIQEFKSLVTDKTKMVIINSPQNPTGGMLTKEDYQEIADFLADRNIVILSDEIYENVVYEEPSFSISSLPHMREKTIILNGFSKTYAMTGWRAGYGIMPKEAAQQIGKLVVNSTSCLAGFTQMACIEALTGPQDEVLRRAEQFRIRRDRIVDGLNAISGVTCLKPRGAFYVFPNIKAFGKTSKEMAEYLLNEAGVATLWGSSFGEYGEGYLRISYANSLENLEKAVSQIDIALKKL
ncbi:MULTISPECIES: pyridoxal phosphate-dependent aminotransferase [Dehalobacter]|uniref:Aminotransferase n=2 Tax=Dehalobacter restrictus TaxID=55583 RepID=A0A857DH78_9FIRM|nr:MULTISPECIES: pyridoxal phosphate-dependent aminotransferase [Dehalobacter]AHF10089.1 aspartate aminotransferase [Dehalobacter restrictus DSM 9455]MCG1025303.1 pyridoxal phosphate-dependent aminotransferase [Dehalobacter sp.]MDJ0306168.1 pyridoxal phosphate-dependent aminotransferase [Dehalobacter sp.]OCZ51992.1 aspartate aminotransferase [Dehalobacter sp. TeCB1]QHA00690.1 aminotransferase class I/II-fold pyridoxal phosphate-dependent enzyme [Dehalobacter restrictus]